MSFIAVGTTALGLVTAAVTTGGCQQPDLPTQTNTAHEPLPAEPLDMQPGCKGLPISSQQELAQGLQLHAKQAGDLSDVDVVFNEKINSIFLGVKRVICLILLKIEKKL